MLTGMPQTCSEAGGRPYSDGQLVEQRRFPVRAEPLDSEEEAETNWPRGALLGRGGGIAPPRGQVRGRGEAARSSGPRGLSVHMFAENVSPSAAESQVS